MPTNLPKEALVKYKKVLEAKTKEEKIKALEEYLSTIPKHKGTENLIAEVKKRISKLKKELESKRKVSSSNLISIKKTGDIFCCLIGFTKAGKSHLFNSLTNCFSEYGERPFITDKPVNGTLKYKGISIQIVDLPSLTENESKFNKIVFSACRIADVILIVVDFYSAKKDLESIKNILLENKIDLKKCLILINKADFIGNFEEIKIDIPYIYCSSLSKLNLDLIPKKILEISNYIKVYLKEKNEENVIALKDGAKIIDLAKTLGKEFYKNFKYAKVNGIVVGKDYVLKDEDLVEIKTY